MGSERHLHIVSLAIPWPTNYGGVIDIFHKVRMLHQLGVKVHLHCWQYGRKPAPELEQYCEEVRYYPRLRLRNPYLGRLPYIVKTRRSRLLEECLLKDQQPILFEGLHTCYPLLNPEIQRKRTVVRAHNVEHDYYRYLGHQERNLLKQLYFSKEAERLKQWEQVLEKASAVAAISLNDQEHFQRKYGHSHYVPVFHGNEQVAQLAGRGRFCLYHGNLSVPENREAALYLIREVWQALDLPLLVAGMNPGRELAQAAASHPQVELVANPSAGELEQLIREAQVHVLPTFQSTGIKLKLLNVLYNGRHCVVNSSMVTGTGLEPLVQVANTSGEMRKMVEQQWEMPFINQERQPLLKAHFDMEMSAQGLLKLLF